MKTKSKDSQVMITDFGLSKILRDDHLTKTSCGTVGYCSPEVLYRKSYGKEVDMWSLGVIVFVLLCGYLPVSDVLGIVKTPII